MTGRFISQDPLGFAAGNANFYEYVGNNSLAGTDSTGLSGPGDIMQAAGDMLSGLGGDLLNMAKHPIETLSGFQQGQHDGAAMIINAATFQLTPLNNYVEGRIALQGGGYGIANFSANVGVSILYAVAIPCGWVKSAISLMSAARDVTDLANGIMEADAGKIAMALVGIGMSLVGPKCFVEGTQIAIADQGHTVSGAPLVDRVEEPETGSDECPLGARAHSGFVCLAVGLGVLVSSRAKDRPDLAK